MLGLKRYRPSEPKRNMFIECAHCGIVRAFPVKLSFLFYKGEMCWKCKADKKDRILEEARALRRAQETLKQIEKAKAHKQRQSKKRYRLKKVKNGTYLPPSKRSSKKALKQKFTGDVNTLKKALQENKRMRIK